MAQFEMLQAALKAQDVRQLLAKCETSGALTREQAAKVKARIDAGEAADMELAKSIRPGPTLQEIVRRGYFSELPRAPNQVAAR
jgi:hypothetical protein